MSSPIFQDTGRARLPPSAGYDGAYLAYYHAVLYAIRLNERSIKQTTGIQNLDSGAYLAEPVGSPPYAEQIAIAQFLAWADRRIRRVLRARQKRMKLLEEYKQNLIHRAVTGQIDVRTGQPYPAYKPSGVEWLGEVPEHWELRKIRQCGVVEGGMTPSMEVRRYWGGLIPWVTPKDMKRSAIRESSMMVTEAALRETSLRLIDPPAILLVVRGMILARKVPVARTTVPVTINQDMKALTPGQGVDAAYLALLLSSAQDAFAPLIDEAGHGTRRLPTERWRDVQVALPPSSEQGEIVRFLNEQCERIDTAIAADRRQIDLLKELRTRLIADVVTGKLDVREVAASLPDEPEADESDLSDEEEALEPKDDATEEELAAASAAEA